VAGGAGQWNVVLKMRLEHGEALHELRRFSEQRGISKPDLAAALGYLQAHQRQRQAYFRTAYLRPPGPA